MSWWWSWCAIADLSSIISYLVHPSLYGPSINPHRFISKIDCISNDSRFEVLYVIGNRNSNSELRDSLKHSYIADTDFVCAWCTPPLFEASEKVSSSSLGFTDATLSHNLFPSSSFPFSDRYLCSNLGIDMYCCRTTHLLLKMTVYSKKSLNLSTYPSS